MIFKLNTPLFGWAKGELLSYDSEWNAWKRKKTGEEFDLRGSIAEGEKVLALNALMINKLSTILEPVNGKNSKNIEDTRPW
jgi:hypothetical protein